MKRSIVRVAILLALSAFLCGLASLSYAAETTFRIGMIGLDTSHVIAFTKYLNDPASNTGCTVVAAFKGGSADIASSADRIDGYTRRMQDDFGVKLVDSIEELCTMVDGIMLESVDGRPHLEEIIRQYLQVVHTHH